MKLQRNSQEKPRKLSKLLDLKKSLTLDSDKDLLSSVLKDKSSSLKREETLLELEQS